MIRPVHIIGGGLAGSEAAWQLAEQQVPVILYEMRPPNRERMFIKQNIWQNWSVQTLSVQMIIRPMRLGYCIRKCGN